LYSLTKISPFLTPSKHTLEYNFVYIIGIPIVCFGGIGASWTKPLGWFILQQGNTENRYVQITAARASCFYNLTRPCMGLLRIFTFFPASIHTSSKMIISSLQTSFSDIRSYQAYTEHKHTIPFIIYIFIE